MKTKIYFNQDEIQITEGLTSRQAELLRQKYGRNELTPPKRNAWWKDFLEKFEDPTIIILLAAAFLALSIAAVEKWVLKSPDASFLDTIGIFIAIGLATLVGYFSERKSAREFELLNKVKEDITVKALRDGQLTEIHIADVVPGDILKLSLGDKIPADGLILDSYNLSIEESMMTGESLPAVKHDLERESLRLENSEELDALNVLSNPSFAARGTMVADGSGWMCVTAVGDKTQMGKIASALTSDSYKSETPLTAKLARLAKTISAFGVAGALLIFTIMSVEAMLNSPLLTQFIKESQNLLIVFAAAAAVLGMMIVRFLLRPFFKSMDLEVQSLGLRFLCFIPMTMISFTLILGIYSMLSAPSPESVLFTNGLNLLQEVLLSFVVAVTIIVVAVPEGLPMMVTVSLALNMMKMARENCLVRKLVASETIGSATVICTDKTGTLTQNHMTPVWVVLGETIFTKENMAQIVEYPSWDALTLEMAVNNTGDLHIQTEKDGSRNVHGIGNPTECAILKFLDSRKLNYTAMRESQKVVSQMEYNSARKMSCVTIEETDGVRCCIKGAPERILALCTHIRVENETLPINNYRDFLNTQIQSASEKSLRLLAFCECAADLTPQLMNLQFSAAIQNTAPIVWMGLIGIADPIRPEVPEAVAQCGKAGIQVKMVTGDALPTAKAIALESGIYTGAPNEIVMTSAEFNEISDEKLPEIAKELRVLARSTPSDKLRLVKALHRNNDVVAMTGDGTNDAPALKAADVGLSMGRTGTEVAKEASDIVMLDDNFSNIVTGVLWGRTLFQNIQRFLQFQLSVNAVALLCAVIGPCVGVPLPLTVTQLLWINIIMDTFAAIAYSTQPPRRDVLNQKPIPRNASIITPAMIANILMVGIYQTSILFTALFQGWFVESEHKYNASLSILSPEYLAHNMQSLTIFFTMLVMFQFWHKFNCRALTGKESAFYNILKCRGFLSIVLLITVTQVILVQVPHVGAFFRTEPLSLRQWLDITAVTSSVLVVGWLTRKISLLFKHY